jgi:hypothetical protein
MSFGGNKKGVSYILYIFRLIKNMSIYFGVIIILLLYFSDHSSQYFGSNRNSNS